MSNQSSHDQESREELDDSPLPKSSIIVELNQKYKLVVRKGKKVTKMVVHGELNREITDPNVIRAAQILPGLHIVKFRQQVRGKKAAKSLNVNQTQLLYFKNVVRYETVLESYPEAIEFLNRENPVQDIPEQVQTITKSKKTSFYDLIDKFITMRSEKDVLLDLMEKRDYDGIKLLYGDEHGFFQRLEAGIKRAYHSSPKQQSDDGLRPVKDVKKIQRRRDT